MASEELIKNRPVERVAPEGSVAAVTVDSLKATVLPDLFANTSQIGE